VSKVIVGDADAIIALALENDPHHKQALTINSILVREKAVIIFPFTALPEAITTLKRALNQPDKAHRLSKQLGQGLFHVEYPNQEILCKASQIFETAVSKKNTFFDAIVAATAKSLEADAIFSFDEWYTKLGFRLASDLPN